MHPDNESYQAHRQATYEEARIRAAAAFTKMSGEKYGEVMCVARALLANNEQRDVKAFVLDHELLSEFDIQNEYGINPDPLFNLNEVTSDFRAQVHNLIQEEESDVQLQGNRLLNDIEEIRTQKLLGRNTASKLAYIQNILGVSFNILQADEIKRRLHLDPDLRHVQQATLELLHRQKQRLKDSEKVAVVDKMIETITGRVFQHQLHRMAGTHPSCSWDINEFCRIYADEIAQCVGEYLSESGQLQKKNVTSLHYRKNTGIEVIYSPRDEKFLTLGDVYGDCTAQEVRSQVDPEIANIHWTVYPWLLDPYYRVLETFVDGEPVVKGHITPLIVQGISTLTIDAIETIPKMRNIVKGKENAYLSQRLFNQRQEILGSLLETAKKIGEDMGVEQVLVDKFSNATWIQEALQALPPKFYHVSDVHKPFGVSIVKRLVSDILQMKEHDFNVEEEIQFLNVNLWSQGLREGYKEAGFLVGEESGSPRIVAGP